MNEIGKRIEEIIRAERITKTQFASDIGISVPSVSNFCSGKTKPAQTTITVICSRYGINRAWLEDGTGEMYADTADLSALGGFVADLSAEPPDSFRNRLIRALAKLDPDDWAVLEKLAAEIASGTDKSE